MKWVLHLTVPVCEKIQYSICFSQEGNFKLSLCCNICPSCVYVCIFIFLFLCVSIWDFVLNSYLGICMNDYRPRSEKKKPIHCK
ncbi:hypothetical protein XENTR_v10016965 [Xenopus tropicalis]|nr:hypothetical protein XENTR_v10016965 [Xenopus tropicalis]